jgi:hypothetical protein
LGMIGAIHAAPTTSAPRSGSMDALLVFVFYLSLPIRGGRASSNC